MSDTMRELPIGFSLTLATNEAAMRHYAAMNPAQQAAVIDQSRQAHTKEDMERLVASIAAGGTRDRFS